MHVDIKHWISFCLKCCRITTVYCHWNNGDPPGASHFTKCRKRNNSIFKPTSTATKWGPTTTKSGTTTTESGASRKTIYKTKETSEPPWFIIANYHLLEYIWNWVVVRSYFSNFCVKKKFYYILYMYLLNFCLNQIVLFMSQY